MSSAYNTVEVQTNNNIWRLNEDDYENVIRAAWTGKYFDDILNAWTGKYFDDILNTLVDGYFPPVRTSYPVSEPAHPGPEQVKESGWVHTDCKLLQPQETALIGALLLLLVYFFF